MRRALALGPALLGAGLLSFPGQSVNASACAMLDGRNAIEAVDPTAGSCRTVQLYGSRSGFAKARLDRKSITVGPLPGHLDTPANREILDLALDEWNRAAGWWLFMPDFEGTNQDVQFLMNADETCPLYGACTGWEQFETGWYRHAYIMLHPYMPPLKSTIAHELGHALGFEDVPTTESGYFGIMSYARRGDLWPHNDQDMASLAAAGYRDEFICLDE